MLELRKAYGFDEQKAIKGVWIDIENGSARVLVGMLGTPQYQKVLFEAGRKIAVKARLNKASMEEQLAVVIEAEAKSILLGWEDILLDGKPLPYTHANAVMLLTRFPNLRAEIESYASETERFQDPEDMEADVKNSLASSTGI